MSLRYEQYRSLKLTRMLLRDLLTIKDYPKTKAEMRDRVVVCLRHFPVLHNSGQPMWSMDDLTEDV